MSPGKFSWQIASLVRQLAHMILSFVATELFFAFSFQSITRPMHHLTFKRQLCSDVAGALDPCPVQQQHRDTRRHSPSSKNRLTLGCPGPPRSQ